MARVQLPDNYEVSDFPFLDKAGDWGPGCEHEATCTVTSCEGVVTAGSGPGWDKDCAKATYSVIRVTIAQAGLPAINEDLWFDHGRDKNRLFKTLGDLGVEIDSAGGYEDDDLTNMAVIITTGIPKDNKKVDPPVPAYSNIRRLMPC